MTELRWRPSSGGHVANARETLAEPSTVAQLTSRVFRLALVAVVLAAVPVEARAQFEVVDREYPIKAAFLYQFSKYVEWPESSFESADAPFVIGVYKTNPFGAMLQRIADTKEVRGRAIQIKVVTEPEDCRRCHILFVSEAVAQEERTRVVEAAREAAVLVVGESDEFVRHGGDAQFFIDGNKVRFAFENLSGDGRGLDVSSKLLSLARPAPESPSSESAR